MPTDTIKYIHAQSKILIIQPPDWSQPRGYSAGIRIFLGAGTESLPATAMTIPGGRAYITCEDLFSGGPKGGFLLPLKIGDVVLFDVEGADIRIIAVLRDADAAPYLPIHYYMPINVLFAAHPSPPVQPAVGNAPIGFLNQLPAGHYGPTQFTDYDVNAPLTRAKVRAICTNPGINPLAAYAVAMAWGGQQHGHFAASIAAPALIPLLNALRVSVNTRSHDYAVADAAAAGIHGLGIAFFTKLLYFFRPTEDAYILDQWTAKSACVLFDPCHIRLGARGAKGYLPPANDTIAAEYEAFCLAVEGLGKVLWPGLAATGAQAEAAMFDDGRGRGMWRVFIKDHFVHQEVGNALAAGARCLTTAQDFDDGLLIIEKSGKVHVYLRPGTTLTGSTRWGTAIPLDFLRILLAKIRQLGAAAVHFPTGVGGVPLPDWFRDACRLLGVEIGGDTAEYVDDDDEQDDEPEPQQPPNNPNAGAPAVARQEPPPVPLGGSGGAAGTVPPQPLRKLISDAHIASNLPQPLRHEQAPARITVTARPRERNAHIRWQYHLNKNAVKIDLFFSGEENEYRAVADELGIEIAGIECRPGGSFKITRVPNIPIDPTDLPATAKACVEAMKAFYEKLRTNSATVRSW